MQVGLWTLKNMQYSYSENKYGINWGLQILTINFVVNY